MVGDVIVISSSMYVITLDYLFDGGKQDMFLLDYLFLLYPSFFEVV